MDRRRFCLAAAAGATLALAGCVTNPAAEPVRVDLIDANYRAVDALLASARLDSRQPLLVATLVNLDALNESSRLGRLFSEQISSRMTMHGYGVEELKVRENLFIQSEGAMLLSREVQELSQDHRAQAVLVGTYASSRAMLYVSLKLVVPTGNIIVAAHDYALPLDANMRDLLAVRAYYGHGYEGGKIVR